VSPLRELVELITERAAAVEGRPLLVGIAGPVSVGKTTLAEQLRDELPHTLTVETVTTDGFLFPNAELDARGITMKKGFPESFDVGRLSRFLTDVRDGSGDLRVPVYSHLIYDVIDEELTLSRPDVLIVEGVVALLSEFVEMLDIAVYVDADDDAVVEWFTSRLILLCRAAADEPASFYAPYASMSDAQIRQFATSVWDSINAVNLDQHIRPARDRATVVVQKAPDHTIRRVVIR
jgi:type I pantothenate kinase